MDLGYSFVQHYQLGLDGDLASIVVPSTHYQKVLEDPFGLSVITEDAVYAAPNRYFVHWTMTHYFRVVPSFLQYFFTPIDSLYLSCALAKISIQGLLLYLLVVYISFLFNALRKREAVLVLMVLLLPLFQTSGYNKSMGIIDLSITYTFFYALPLAVLLVFFLPFFKSFIQQKDLEITWLSKFLLLVLVVVLPFSGALIPGVVLITSLLIFIKYWSNIFYTSASKNLLFITIQTLKSIPKSVVFYFGLMSVLCLYSIYIGRNNIENIGQELPFLERVSLVPFGLWKLLTTKLGLGLLTMVVAFNTFLIRKFKDGKGQEIRIIGKWLLFFSLLYILLLPIGGYRWYRPNIVRYDTIMPVTICLFYYFGLSSFFLLKNIKNKYKIAYKVFIGSLLILYTLADEPIKNTNLCERKALEKIAKSTEQIVEVADDCLLFSWDIIKEASYSKTNGEFFYLLNITEEKKLYFQRKLE